jgi:hypothetical protein
MSANSEILANHGAKHSFDWKEKTYEVAYLDRKRKTVFEKHMFKRAREVVALNKEIDGTSQEDYEKVLDKLNADYVAGKFSLESELGMAYIKSFAGQLYLSSLLTGVDEDTMLKIYGDMKQEVLSLIKLVLTESLPQVKDPNANAPA